MKQHLIYIIIIAIVVVVFSIKSCSDEKKWQKLTNDYRETIISSDRLHQDEQGNYKKLANDFHTEKTLRKILEQQNSDLAKTIKDNKGTINSLTRIIASFKKKDTVIKLPDDAFNPEDSTISFTSFYPDKINPFATFAGVINTQTKSLRETWSFNEFTMDIVMNETPDGFFQAVVDVPDFMTLGEVTVNRLPADKDKGLGNWGFIIGGGYNRYFTSDSNKVTGFNLNPGVRFKQFYLLGEIGTVVGDPRIDGMAGIKLLYEFK